MAAYPEAKIILNTRPFPSWKSSFLKNITPIGKSWRVYLESFLHPLRWREWRLWNRVLVNFWHGDREFNLRNSYDQHHALVRGLAAQQGRELLEWQVTEGW